MKTDENLSIGIIKRIVFIALVLIILLGIGVFAGNQSVNNVTIKFSDGTELNVITSKSNVNEILKENNIYILESEVVTPDFSENVDSNKTITITRKDKIKEVQEESVVSEIVESNEILNDQGEKIVEKIVKETVEIPFETITKEVSESSEGEKVNRVLQEGQNGIKEINYREYGQYSKKVYQTSSLPKGVLKLVDNCTESLMKTGVVRNKFYDPDVINNINNEELLKLMHKEDIDQEKTMEYRKEIGIIREDKIGIKKVRDSIGVKLNAKGSLRRIRENRL